MAKESKEGRAGTPTGPMPVLPPPSVIPSLAYSRDESQLRRETQTELGRLQGQLSQLRVQAHDLQATVAQLTAQRMGLDAEIGDRRHLAQAEADRLRTSTIKTQERLTQATREAEAMERLRLRDEGRVEALREKCARLTTQLQEQGGALIHERTLRETLRAVQQDLQTQQEALRVERAATDVVRAERTKLAGEIQVARAGAARQVQMLTEREEDLISVMLVLEERERVCGARLLKVDTDEHRLAVVQHALEEQETALGAREQALRETGRAQAKLRERLDHEAQHARELMEQAQDALARAKTMQEVARLQDEAVARSQRELEASSAAITAAQGVLDDRGISLDAQQAMLQRVSVEITHARGRLLQEAKRLQVDPGVLGVPELPARKG